MTTYTNLNMRINDLQASVAKLNDELQGLLIIRDCFTLSQAVAAENEEVTGFSSGLETE